MAKQAHLVVKEAEALIVGPDEKLILHLPESTPYEDAMIEELHESLASIGLAERSLILVGEVEFAKVRD